MELKQKNEILMLWPSTMFPAPPVAAIASISRAYWERPSGSIWWKSNAVR